MTVIFNLNAAENSEADDILIAEHSNTKLNHRSVPRIHDYIDQKDINFVWNPALFHYHLDILIILVNRISEQNRLFVLRRAIRHQQTELIDILKIL